MNFDIVSSFDIRISNFNTMNKQLFVLTVFIVVALVFMVIWQETKFNDGKLHIVFCDVGQGDAIFIRTPGKTDILLDGGPDRKVLDCLAAHMPFWDRAIELMLLSHPHQDHFAGLIDVLGSYQVVSFATEKLRNDTAGYRELEEQLDHVGLKTSYLTSGNVVRADHGVSISVVAPSREFLEKTSVNGEIQESEGFGTLILRLSYGEFSLLLTSDAQILQLREAGDISVDVLQVPHHGSRFGIDRETLDKLAPAAAIISVGKNRYGHPTDEILSMLKGKEISILRTDQDGEIEIVSDGKTWSFIQRL